ncbi:hypothetical protein [Qaidamihabitans albus]|uniref:hypothetical protein n=1 Tax=Qaidamihabitans albus TaxID=2795733 RepID=UPI0018F1ADE0|nr:hypothetical protein [Qaidamihabitans albus]
MAFTYRSHRHEYDPEPALRHAAEVTVAALVAAGHERTLRTTAETLCSALARLQCTIADTYLGKGVTRRLSSPRPDMGDRHAVDTVDRLLAAGLERAGPAAAHPAAAETVCRSRIFLTELHHWSRTRTPGHEWDG